MREPIYYHQYVLESQQRLNAKSARQSHSGALIRLGDGFGCVHPWEVLGDEPLDQQLAAMASGRQTNLVAKALECAEVDAAARIEGRSLFEKIEVPASHATIVGGIAQVQAAVEAGFDHVKLKAGMDVEADADRVNEVAETFPELSLRIDFNCHLSGSQVAAFIERLRPTTRHSIQFLEDPCGYHESCWTGLRNLYGIRLAMDIGVESIDALYSFAVIKPAKNKVDQIMEAARSHARRVVFTSYMDHPLGQAYAAYEAGRCNAQYGGVVDVCGLMTHQLFEPSEFSETLGEVRPEWTHRSGFGLGFDQLLEGLEWKRLI